MFDNAIFHLGLLHGLAEQPFERGDPPVGDPAGHDELEMVEVGGDIEREAVARNPARDAYADRRELLLADPDAGQPFHPTSLDAVIGGGTDEDGFEVAHVAVDVAAARVQVDDGITDELPGTVIGDVAAPAGLMDLDIARR